MIDSDNNNYISKAELKNFLNVSSNSPVIEDIFDEVDKDNDENISFEEFTSCIENLFKQSI